MINAEPSTVCFVTIAVKGTRFHLTVYRSLLDTTDALIIIIIIIIIMLML